MSWEQLSFAAFCKLQRSSLSTDVRRFWLERQKLAASNKHELSLPDAHQIDCPIDLLRRTVWGSLVSLQKLHPS